MRDIIPKPNVAALPDDPLRPRWNIDAHVAASCAAMLPPAFSVDLVGRTEDAVLTRLQLKLIM